MELQALVSLIRSSIDAEHLNVDPDDSVSHTAIARLESVFGRVEQHLGLAAKELERKPIGDLTPADCTCKDRYATVYLQNPEGHYVDCPLWGTAAPHP